MTTPPDTGTPPPAVSAPPGSSAPVPPVSALAVAALVLALVPCCPPTSLLGVLLGLFALRRIRASSGRLGGRRIALCATLIGAVMAVVSAVAFEQFVLGQQAQQTEAMIDELSAVILAAQDGDGGEVASRWSPAARPAPSADEIVAFGAETLERYGRLGSVSVVSTTRVGGWLSTHTEAACLFRFEDASPLGSARFSIQIVPGRLTGELRPMDVVIEDSERGDVRLGPSAAASP